MTTLITHINGAEADARRLAPLAFAGFAHFTAMQVRDGRVRGLDLHLSRLRDASNELFGTHLPDERMLDYLRAALLAAPRDVSLNCFITPANSGDGLDVVVRVTDPHTVRESAISLDVVAHQRHLPHIKHVGEVAKTQYQRSARARGFDDSAFVDHTGRLSEATIWNLAFWDKETVIWPQADVLPGVTMQILKRQLAALGVPQSERPIKIEDVRNQKLDGVVMNSWTPGISIDNLGDIDLSGWSGRGADNLGDFVRLLNQAYVAEVPVPLIR